MHKKLKFSFQKKILFSKWTRKSYAIFQSLGKIIKIAKLKDDIAEGFILKSISIEKTILSLLSTSLLDENIDSKIELSIENLIISINQQTSKIDANQNIYLVSNKILNLNLTFSNSVRFFILNN